MIVPTKKLTELIRRVENQAQLANEVLRIDPALLSRVLSQEQGASARVIERLYQWCRWSLTDMWEIVESNESEQDKEV
jgi:hypothetical protein